MSSSLPSEVNSVEYWIPEMMNRGDIAVYAQPRQAGKEFYAAVMSCPVCGTEGLIKKNQLQGIIPMICGGDDCSAEYRLDGSRIIYRPPQ